MTGKPTIYLDDCASDHLHYAAQRGYALLTSNPADFVVLHQQWQAQGQVHAGILLVYYDNIKAQDMQPHDIVDALENLITSGLPLTNAIYNLNQWRQ